VRANRDIAVLRPDATFGARNGGWAYDAYPEMETLDKGRAITIAEIEGPAVITNLHTTQHWIHDDALTPDERRALTSRGVLLEITFDEHPAPSVRVPLADFFADGCCGRAQHFSTPFVEKAPESYNCFLPMPFARSARVVLRNETSYNLGNYSFVEFETLPEWDARLGYFHATWNRFAFPLYADTDQSFFHVDGSGHLVGRAWSVSTDEPYFRDFHFVMEANNEFRLDGESAPRADYLGTEDSFGFSWGFRQPFIGLYNGMNLVQGQEPSLLSIYRFRQTNPMRFRRSLDLRVDWSHEWRGNAPHQERMAAIRESDGGWIDYATTFYWYQEHVGYEHAPLMPLDERAKTLLHPNPAEDA